MPARHDTSHLAKAPFDAALRGVAQDNLNKRAERLMQSFAECVA